MLKGQNHTEKSKEKIRKHKKGQISWNKGLKSKTDKRIKAGKNHYRWKGGISKNKKYLSWLKNRRNRLKKASEGSHTFGEWELLKKQYGFKCPFCRIKEPEIVLTEDHIIPLSRGGSDFIENIQPLCKSCNSKKYNKIISKS